MTIEILQPASIPSVDDFRNACMLSSAFQYMERRNKNKPDEYWICAWDEAVAPAPTEAELLIMVQTATDNAIADEAKKVKKAADMITLRDALGTNRNSGEVNAALDMLVELVLGELE